MDIQRDGNAHLHPFVANSLSGNCKYFRHHFALRNAQRWSYHGCNELADPSLQQTLRVFGKRLVLAELVFGNEEMVHMFGGNGFDVFGHHIFLKHLSARADKDMPGKRENISK
ncbi:hypothetical protein Bhyg_15610 [Pseudolycoriella hygida]|uniref:Uncharacterized protein n=1 Tax=Pseudolycoriella hygida TaxID=35572 RepID=A0A9Q0MKX0_9DIPT|nr:hypothetical protein Bhyg_15610 [Pseudolycoriella hygida]